MSRRNKVFDSIIVVLATLLIVFCCSCSSENDNVVYLDSQLHAYYDSRKMDGSLDSRNSTEYSDNMEVKPTPATFPLEAPLSISIPIFTSTPASTAELTASIVDNIIQDIDDRVSWIKEGLGEFIHKDGELFGGHYEGFSYEISENFRDYYYGDSLLHRIFSRDIDHENFVVYSMFYGKYDNLIYAEMVHYRGAMYSMYFSEDALVHTEVGPFSYSEGAPFVNGDLAHVKAVIKEDGFFVFILEDLAACLENAYVTVSGSSEVRLAQLEITPPTTSTQPESAYSNPIDEYFLPLIETASPEITRREYQDTYRGVWKSEFENIIQWSAAKYTYQHDIDALSDFMRSAEQLIAKAQALAIAELRAEFDISPGAPESAPWGTGTRSWLNQLEGEIYRDAGMLLIRSISYCDDYIFLDIDYSKEHYE